MYPRTIVVLVVVIVTIQPGHGLSCFECRGDRCNLKEQDDIATCNSNSVCYLAVNGNEEVRSCEPIGNDCKFDGVTNGNFNHMSINNGNVCKICNQNLCNSGKYDQNGQIDCYSCEGDSCNEPEATMSTCRSTRCYYSVKNGKELRGCAPSLDSVVSHGQSQTMFFNCQSDKCNSKKGYEDFTNGMKKMEAELSEGNKKFEKDMKKFSEDMEKFGEHMKNMLSNMPKVNVPNIPTI